MPLYWDIRHRSTVNGRGVSKHPLLASPGSMCNTGCLGLVHWDDPEGGYGEGGGRRVQDGEHGYTCGRFISMFGKLIQYCKV